jgi:orotate phosphoribosyltransferase-like protein
MSESTKLLITLLREHGMHDQADQIVANWEQIAALQTRIKTLTDALADQREINENYASAHRIANLHK